MTSEPQGRTATVGIMSMQRIHNYGSTLQAYSLRRLVEQVQPGSTVSFVDYEPGPALPVSASDGSEPRTRVSRTVGKLREYGDIDAKLRDKLKFFNHKRSYGSKYFPMVGIPPQRNRDLHLDLQVIGSDEVFNCVQSNSNVGYARDLFGHESPARRLISYAGSFGNTTLEKIDAAGIRGELAESFARFDAISVRDRNSQTVIEELTGSRPELHLDPTLVFDLVGLESRIPAERQFADKYVIVYGYSGRINADENRAVRRYADSIGARVLAFGGLQAAADKFIDCDPFTLLAYFRDAEAVVTDTFHGTIFSIINEVPFASIIRSSSALGYGNEEKLGWLLETLGLGDRALRTGTDLEVLLDDSIDFSRVRAITAGERIRSLDYLSAAVSGTGKA